MKKNSKPRAPLSLRELFINYISGLRLCKMAAQNLWYNLPVELSRTEVTPEVSKLSGFL